MAFFALAAQASLGGASMGLMDFEARGSQEPQAVLDVRRTTRTRVPADDEATKKGANPNAGGSDEPRYRNSKD